MKKMFMLVAMLFATFMVFANPNTDVEAKAKAFAAQMASATKAQDTAKLEQISQAVLKYHETLSAADKTKFETIMQAALAEGLATTTDAVTGATTSQVEAKAKEYAARVATAYKAGDMVQTEQIYDEARAYYRSLSDADKNKFSAILDINSVKGPKSDADVVAKATQLTNKVVEAIKAGDSMAAGAYAAEADAYYRKLSSDQKATFNEVSNKILKAAGLAK